MSTSNVGLSGRSVGWKLYRINLTHKTFDWNASFEFTAPDARKARRFALAKMAAPESWLVTSARQVKP